MNYRLKQGKYCAKYYSSLPGYYSVQVYFFKKKERKNINFERPLLVFPFPPSKLLSRRPSLRKQMLNTS